MPVTTTRQKILAHLKKNRLASAQEIARALHVTPADARHHLGILAADGRVTAVGQRGKGRGRPVKMYGLSGALAGDNLPGLLDAVLAEWLGGLSPSKREQALGAVAGRLGTPPEGERVPLMRRLAATVERLNQLHYQARWEAGAEGPRIILGQCPYAAVIGNHPELCRMDMSLLEGMLDTQVEQRVKLGPMCIFLVG
jgi:predicted ArsR family transcriptional regulator